MSAPARPPALQTVLFPPVGGEGRVEAVVRRLGEAISLGLLEAGERLPPEAELATRFGVAQVTLREALAVLRQAGLIETRRGRGGGTFVRPHRGTAAVEEIRARYGDCSAAGLHDLETYAKAISGAAAALAARRASRSDIETLHGLADAMRDASSLAESMRAASRLQIEIAAASQNARLTKAEIAVQSELNALVALLPDQQPLPSAAGRQGERTLQAIAAGDAPAARASAEDLVESLTDLVIGLVLPTLEPGC